MKFWLGPVCGAVIVGIFGALKLRQDWSLGGEHAFRASGTITAYFVAGAFLGLFVAILLSALESFDRK
jgi:hypothetical protein